MAFTLTDPFLLIVLTIIILFIFALYLMFRRTILAFQEGVEGKNR